MRPARCTRTRCSLSVCSGAGVVGLELSSFLTHSRRVRCPPKRFAAPRRSQHEAAVFRGERRYRRPNEWPRPRRDLGGGNLFIVFIEHSAAQSVADLWWWSAGGRRRARGRCRSPESDPSQAMSPAARSTPTKTTSRGRMAVGHRTHFLRRMIPAYHQPNIKSTGRRVQSPAER